MLNLLYITNGTSGSGGLERVLAVKASYLADKLNYEVHILTLNDGNNEQFYEFSNKILFHDVKAGGNAINYFLQYRNGIKNVIKTVKPDVVSVCDDGLKGMLFPILFSKKTPVIYERHASFEIFKKKEKSSFFQKTKLKLFKLVLTWAAKKFDTFVVLTKNNLKEWNLPNMQVIPNPLSFYPDTNSSLTNKKVIAVGNHGFTKGFDRLLLIWKDIAKKHPDWQLEIYGKKDKTKKLEKLIEQFKIENSVQLFDPVSNIQEKYLEASIYVLPSRSEGFGMVLIEAMACGLPCIAFDCPSGPKDIITHQEDGFLVKNGEINDFTNAILLLIKNKENRKQIGTLAKRNVKRYLPKNIVPIWNELFKNLIK